ncbi:MAG: helix-turn-helix domain-containing protein [Nanoarchaeota archaeon]
MEELKTLMKLGLTEYEARAYLSLAKLGPSTVREIVLESKLPRNKAYEALQKLEQKNMVLSLLVSPRKYKISNPEIFKEQIDHLSTSINLLIKTIEQPKTNEFKELFWVIKGKKAIEDKLASQNIKVRKEILACNRLSKILYKNIRSLKEGIKRGIKVRMICSYDPHKKEVYKAWLNTGAEIRVFNKEVFGPLLPRISIFDGETSRMTLGKPEVQKEEDYITLWTESKAFSQMLRNHFLYMWKKCKPLRSYLK